MAVLALVFVGHQGWDRIFWTCAKSLIYDKQTNFNILSLDTNYTARDNEFGQIKDKSL